jgi:8-oxo-dGTP pyrophosphatase MutT (NUDIX family)
MPRDFIASLRTQLNQRQNIPDLLHRFAPSHSLAQRFQTPPAHAREASVIVALYRRDNTWHLPLVVRPTHMKHHSGQVALPGGAREPDETLAHTALRELDEELGIPATSIQLLGPLSPFYVPASGFQVHPWVGWIAEEPAFRPNPSEVQELLEIPAGPILNLSTLGSETREINDIVSEVPYFALGAHKAWGATCIVLGELAMVCKGLDASL